MALGFVVVVYYFCELLANVFYRELCHILNVHGNFCRRALDCRELAHFVEVGTLKTLLDCGTQEGVELQHLL